MANKYFGNVGDVFKHLLLADILAGQQPREYWESHAGSASYPWVDSPARRHGINRLYQALSTTPTEAPALAQTHYATLLRALNPEGLKVVPGSPLLAMRLLPKYGIRIMPGDTLPAKAKDALLAVRGANTAIKRLQVPAELGRSGIYNIFSDRFY